MANWLAKDLTLNPYDFYYAIAEEIKRSGGLHNVRYEWGTESRGGGVWPFPATESAPTMQIKYGNYLSYILLVSVGRMSHISTRTMTLGQALDGKPGLGGGRLQSPPDTYLETVQRECVGAIVDEATEIVVRRFENSPDPEEDAEPEDVFSGPDTVPLREAVGSTAQVPQRAATEEEE